MTSEERDRFETNLKNMALSSFKIFNDNCKFENDLSEEEINFLKTLM